MFKRFFRDEEAVTATEYAVMLALIILASIIAIETLGVGVKGTFETISEDMPSVG